MILLLFSTFLLFSCSSKKSLSNHIQNNSDSLETLSPSNPGFSSDIQELSLTEEDNLIVNTNYSITWKSNITPNPGLKFRLDFYNGSQWSNIVDASYLNQSYNWITPSNPSQHSKIKLTLYSEKYLSTYETREFGIGKAYYLRPLGGSYGIANGTSYANAFNGFANVDWTKIQPGDSVFICGTHIYGTHFNLGQNIIPISGISGAPIVFRGDCPNDRGLLWGGRKIPAAAFNNNGDGTYYVNFSYLATYAAEGNPGNESLMREATSQAECAATNGSMYADSTNHVVWINPFNNLQDIYTNWVTAIDLNGQSYLTLKKLILRGGTGNDGVLRIIKNLSTNAQHNIIKNNDIGFGYYTGIYANRPADYTEIRNNVIHDVPTGTYFIMNDIGQSNHISIIGNEVYSGNDQEGIYGATRADRHALGGMNGDGWYIADNYVHDWAGDGINIYLNGRETDSVRDVIITRNIFQNLSDTKNQYYHWGIYNGFTNSASAANRSTGWMISYNLIMNCTGDVAEKEGIGIRIKGGMPSSGSPPKVFNNVIYNCNYGLVGAVNNDQPTFGVIFKNNLILQPKSEGFHVYITSGFQNPSTAIIDSNFYFPDTLNGNNKFYWNGSSATNFNQWKSLTNQDRRSSPIQDPQLIHGLNNLTTPSDFKPLTTSPLIDLGEDMNAKTDFSNSPIRNFPDIGLFEIN